MSLRTPRTHDDLVNYRIKQLQVLGGAPALRICEGQFGLARQEWRLLAALVEHGTSSPTALAENVLMERARASRTLASLVEKHLVTRSADSGDGRRATVCATAEGRLLYARLFPLLTEVNVRLLSVLEDGELQVFEHCLDKLTANARQVLRNLPADAPKADRRSGGSKRVWDRRRIA
ncbi:MarR family winged helix-turn-helix transcriptional regulator [Ramlibacter algicola]|uniref:Winged helix-turn-helix transcriptional regulator n=1 Tax=Ramlibacter algicola TaxID=2795217 RepID=A0A934Q0R3_9BURK|nr:MarR family winged helix-turn-helix transcriptional regulator [Ramlibacter algicola]MBK0392701.1 winged helix-turn-helix transcriptional regulator [Ramlibacter algicola]